MKLNKDFEFSLKVMVLILLMSFLVLDFVLQIYSPKKTFEGLPTMERLNIYYSFFTTQSNYAVVLYLVAALFMKRIYNSKPVFGIELAMTVYITVTMLVFWFGLLASRDEMDSYYPSNWVSTMVLHLCIPSIMIVYFLLSCGDQYFSYRRYSKFALPLTCTYPVGYLIFAMIRGEIRFNYYSPEFFKKIYSLSSDSWFWTNIWSADKGVIDKSRHFTQQMWYPYWFLNIHKFTLEEKNGTIFSQSTWPQWFIFFVFAIACFAITFLVVSLQFIYLNWNNKKFYNWHDIEGKLITAEEHAYRKQKAKLKKSTAKNEYKMTLLHKKTAYKVFLKSIKSYPKEERINKIKKIFETRSLEQKIKRASIKQQKVLEKSNKQQIKRFILTLNYKDRPFVKENLREAERYKKLVKKGVIIFKTKYVD
ncbi:Pr6Pr family membrane protein [Spiroplasma endosymbiont of Atherix ibis]|uniref:Pr6Pr family membrane protein n=1 Tax=Spiroplasma endosymbiont of Atherix ibis TaxID=3066291 RepID=UPI0030CE0870